MSDGNLRVVGSEESSSYSFSVDIYQGEKSREEEPTVIFETLEKILKDFGLFRRNLKDLEHLEIFGNILKEFEVF